MDNLFLTAMGADKVKAIEQTKENKQFVLRLINDLKRVFKIWEEVSDEQNSSVIRIKAQESYRYMNNRFVANANGVFFEFNALGYYNKASNPRILPLGELYERYKDYGGVADSGFLDNEDRNGHGHVGFKIPLVDGDVSLNQTLRDIVYLLEQDGYYKVF